MLICTSRHLVSPASLHAILYHTLCSHARNKYHTSTSAYLIQGLPDLQVCREPLPQRFTMEDLNQTCTIWTNEKSVQIGYKQIKEQIINREIWHSHRSVTLETITTVLEKPVSTTFRVKYKVIHSHTTFTHSYSHSDTITPSTKYYK